MASFANATRLSTRLVSRRVTQDVATRGFRTCAASLAAQNFTMPALSPTMTEGNIATWKLKEGDSFSAGDVLLEIETDKATMDVEAQDDGIIMKIMHGDGSKNIQVGTRIGVVAESGDDISKLELPADEKTAQPKETKKEEPPRQQESKGATPEKKAAGPKKSGSKAAPQKYPLYPSVEHLIKEHKLDESAISEMTPTGPAGRLLKGDVLAYLGTVSSSRPEEIKARFDHNSHLDLSNIKIAAPKEAPKKAEKSAVPEVPQDLLVTLPISLATVIEVQKKIESTLDTFVPLSTFIARATEVANDNLPLPSNYKPTADELFNQVLGLDKASPSGSVGYYLPQISAVPPSSFTGVAPKPKAKVDIIDFLADTAKKPAPRPQRTGSQSGISTGSNVFSLTVPKTEERRAKAFLQRVKTVLEGEPGRLVL
ncbi:pyruvate dehydrogenase protein x component [Hypoxylon fragiforme]|uniref:pyruvate dehydrogenase protein x component n=1 Tax=Hypoxylon fragiforme TaxID=63214 RepID=UPI0020C5C184|nr:pyruvate dehydrogenase protein x component [Hypoxylon fragiforme]KAI2613068.1 pyruvate dehydrogenase protein x component [Hypoxylon fragiforme]